MLKKLVAISVLVATIAVFSRKSVKEGKTVVTKYGAVKGIISESREGREHYEWLGIPYAKPPLGELRFASPQPPVAWESVRDASSYGSKCAQLELLTNNPTGEEDCLFLNVHAPKLANEERKLPVLVYFHGGGYNVMSSNDYRPDYFMDEDVVVVVLNYRLGVFGFLTTGDKVIRGNMGLKDQTLALKWVKENIGAFGGNPERITIFGESAGGGSVHYQLLSPMSKGLFNQAISMSAVATSTWGFLTAANAKQFTEEYAKGLNCPTEDSAATVECLRSKSALTMLEAYLPQARNNGVLKPYLQGKFFVPTVEVVNDSETFLPQHPLEIVEQGKAHRVPWILGVVSSEGLLSSADFHNDPGKMALYETNFHKNTLRHFGIPENSPGSETIAAKMKDFYFPANLTKTEDKLVQYTKLFSDSYFNLPISYTASEQRKFSPTYLYYLDRHGGPSLTPLIISIKDGYPFAFQALFFFAKQYLNRVLFGTLPEDYGVAHFDDVAFLFHVPNMFYIPKDDSDLYKFSKDYVKLWVSFAEDESMKFRGLQFQPLKKTSSLKYLEISETPKVVDEPFGDRMKFLKSLDFLRTTL